MYGREFPRLDIEPGSRLAGNHLTSAGRASQIPTQWSVTDSTSGSPRGVRAGPFSVGQAFQPDPMTLGRRSSGWISLTYNKRSKLFNQDTCARVPVAAIDIWTKKSLNEIDLPHLEFRVAQSVEPFRFDGVRTQELWWRAGIRPRGDRLPPVLRRDRPGSRMSRAGAARPGADALLGSLAEGP